MSAGVEPDIPTKIQGPRPETLYSSRESLSKETYPNNHIRCMFVGHYGAGKTTLVNGLLKKKRHAKTRSTDGIDIHQGKMFFNKRTKTWHIEGM